MPTLMVMALVTSAMAYLPLIVLHQMVMLMIAPIAMMQTPKLIPVYLKSLMV